jgi:hypothetical protein
VKRGPLATCGVQRVKVFRAGGWGSKSGGSRIQNHYSSPPGSQAYP